MVRKWPRIIGLIAVFGVLAGAGEIVGWLDSTGHIPHESETTVTANADWFIGESKACNSVPAGPSGYALADLECDVNAPKHQVNVTFWGRRNQPEYGLVLWRCIRKENAFSCSQDGWFRNK